MNQLAQNQYIKTQVNTAHPGELTLMLYNGCIKFMKQALESIDNKNFETKNYFIQRAADIIDELQITLNMKYEISNNLYSLYAFMKEKLFEANIKMDKECVNVSIELMTELRDTWVLALKEVKSSSKATV